MRKLILTTAAIAAAIGLAGCSKKALVSEIPNTFTDTRDGQTYKTVTIGTQTWMAQNLNYKPSGGKASSTCNKNRRSNCKKYGRLYHWSVARSVCPDGWRLPDTTDWRTLITTAGGPETAGKKLKSTRGWDDYDGKSGNGTDDFGFSALPGSSKYWNRYFYILCCEYWYGSVGEDGYWWTATGKNYGVSMNYQSDYANVNQYLGMGPGNYNSVRCVADTP